MAQVAVRGVELDVAERGAGRPVIWGHGLSSNRAHEDDFGLLDWDRLAERCRVVRYDARGHGRSAPCDDLDRYSWAELAADQLALADALGIERYVAAGASMGCGTALHAAVAAPERVEALLLVIPPTAWESRQAQVGVWAQLADLVASGGAEAFIAARAQFPPPDPFRDRTEWDAAFARNVRATDPARLATVFRGAANADLPPREALRTIAVPTRILAWSGDAAHPTATAEALAELIAGSELTIASSWDDLQRWTDAACTFLGGLDR